MEGKVEDGLAGFLAHKANLAQDEFVNYLCKQFRDRKYRGVVAQFKKLEQKGALTKYLDQFEELISLLLALNPGLREDYLINSFIGGLSDELAHQ